MAADCTFCRIVARDVEADRVLENADVVAFLDHRPLFAGHVLLVTRAHHETLTDLPVTQIEPLFTSARRLALAVERAMSADGSFVAINNRVSQSVPHLHVHEIPRKRGDGLRGFFWPRHRYPSDEARLETARRIAEALATIGLDTGN